MQKWFKKQNKGFSLIELLVALTIVAIVATIAATTYNGVMQNKRIEMDVETLHSIDVVLKDIIVEDYIFEEMEQVLQHNNSDTYSIRFMVVNEDGDRYVSPQAFYVKYGTDYIKATKTGNMARLYDYLNGYLDEKLPINAPKHQGGYYQIDITFPKVRVSAVRPEVWDNDSFEIVNSADQYLTEWPN